MNDTSPREISCRVTRTLLMYVREKNNGSLGSLLDGLSLDEAYLTDTANWVTHRFLQTLYKRMIALLDDDNAVYNMTLASGRLRSLGLLDRMVRLIGNPRLIYTQAPKYNKLLKLNGDVHVHDAGDNWVILEDRYHQSDQKTRYDCDYTRGILSGIPTMFNMPPARVAELECQVLPQRYRNRRWPDTPRQGCRGCLYLVEWNPTHQLPLWKRVLVRFGIYRQALDDLLQANQTIQEKYDEIMKLVSDLESTNRRLRESKRQMEFQSLELQKSERRYRLLAENVSDTIWTLDLTTMQFTYFSPSVEKNRGFTPEEAIELGMDRTLSPESKSRVVETLTEEREKEGIEGVDPGRSRMLEIEVLHKNGSYVWAETTVSFIRDHNGRPEGILGVTRDISQRKQAEKEAAELAAQLDQSKKMETIGNMAAAVAHDLNNILSGIVGYPELLLLELPGDSPLREKIKTIQRSGQKAAAIVQDLLSLARRGVSSNRVVNLNATISEYLASAEFRQIQKSNLRITVGTDLADDLLNTLGSPVHIFKILMNLMTNAAEAMPAGGRITVRTANVYCDNLYKAYEFIPEGEYVLLTVVDEGIGISATDLKRIFDPFYTKKSMGRSGTGLGMAVIWATVKDHRGYIDIFSREGEGTRIDIYLPASREAAFETDRLVLEDYLGTEKILVVDDIFEQRDIAVKMLGKLGYRVTAAASGEEAVEYMQTHTADLVVLDMIMDPGIDGLETFQRIRELHPHQKAIIASGFSESDRVKELQLLGAGAYVKKPYTLEKIGIAVRRELDRDGF